MKGSLAHKIYSKMEIKERHRHRYEFNNAFRDALENGGMSITGINPQSNLAEIVEIKTIHFYWSAVSPELKSTVENPHPIFVAFIKSITFSPYIKALTAMNL